MERHTDCPADITNRRFGRERSECHDLRDMVVAVLVDDVLDNAIPTVIGKIDVDIRHRDAVGVKESLEEKIVFERVERRNAERVRHDTSGSGSTTGSDQHAVVFGVLHKIPDNQEVIDEAHPLDDAELVFNPGADFTTFVAIEAHDAFVDESVEIFLVCHPARRREVREVIPLESKIEIAHFGNSDRVGEGFRNLPEETLHLLRTLQEELVGFLLQSFFIMNRGVRLDANEEILIGSVFFIAVVNIVCRDKGQAEFSRERNQRPVDVALFLETVILQLDKEAFLAKNLSQRTGIPPGERFISFKDWIRNRSAETRRGGDDAFVVLLEHLHIDAGAVVEAFEGGPGGELEQITIAGFVFRQKKQMIRIAIALRCFPFGEIRLDADDRMQTSRRGGAVPVVGGVHHTVIGHGHVVHVQRLGPIDVLVDPPHTVEERILGVQMEVCELRHQAGTPD